MPPRLQVTNRGNATGDLMWFVAILIGLWFLWFATGGPSRPEAVSGPFIEPPIPAPIGAGDSDRRRSEIYAVTDRSNGNGTVYDLPLPDRSQWFNQVSINDGNGASEIRPGKEYIELTASHSNATPVNVSGWQLVNNPARRVRSDIVPLPTSSDFGSFILRPGARVTLITGASPARSNWPLPAVFRINKCLGYLEEEFETLDITPALPRQCSDPEDEPGVTTLPDKCYDFVRSLSSCHEPEFKEDREGVDRVDGRVDDLTRQCRLYIQEHFSYDKCLAWHQIDPDFYDDDWRVYLGRTWELWAENRERITVYDQLGKLVAEESY